MAGLIEEDVGFLTKLAHLLLSCGQFPSDLPLLSTSATIDQRLPKIPTSPSSPLRHFQHNYFL
jgi:hypothetical protein